MRVRFNGLLIAAAIAAIAGPGSAAKAGTVYEWRYSVDGGAFSASRILSDPNNDSDNVSLFGGKLTISINTSSNNPGNSFVANLFNANTDVVNSTGAAHTVQVQVTETNYLYPQGGGDLTADIGPVTIRRVTTAGPGSGAASASFSAYAAVDLGNVAYGTGAVTSTYSASGGTATTPISLADATLTSASNPLMVGGPFSMTVSDTISLGKNTSGHLEINANLTSVPEPSALVLAGLGVLGLIGYDLRRRARTA